MRPGHPESLISPRLVNPCQKIAASAVSRPTVRLGFRLRQCHERPHVIDATSALHAAWLVANAFAEAPDRGLIPELIVSPANQAKLRMRRCGDSAVPRVGHRKYKLALCPRWQMHQRAAMKP